MIGRDTFSARASPRAFTKDGDVTLFHCVHGGQHDTNVSHPFNVGTENVGFALTRYTLLAPSTKRGVGGDDVPSPEQNGKKLILYYKTHTGWFKLIAPNLFSPIPTLFLRDPEIVHVFNAPLPSLFHDVYIFARYLGFVHIILGYLGLRGSHISSEKKKKHSYS